MDSQIQTTILDLPEDIMHNQIISKYLFEDKSIDKIFFEKDDYYLLNFLCGKIWNVKYIKPNAWNEYKTNINLDCIIHYLNIRHNLNCESLKIMYSVNKNLFFDSYVINIYNNNNKVCFINMLNKIVLNNDEDSNIYLINKECQNTTDKLKNEILFFN